VLGLAGLVGSGRTELAETIFGLRRADTGVVSVSGKPVPNGSLKSAFAQGISYLPEDRARHGLTLGASIGANTTVEVLPDVSRWGVLSRAGEDNRARALISRLSIKSRSPKQHVVELSGGNQQKVAIGRRLERSPRVLILDEPTRGVDIQTKSEIHGLIRSVADKGAAVIVISSDFPELCALCDRAIVLFEGRQSGEFGAPIDSIRLLHAAVLGQVP
jgi:ABC-type sugar transport system ATPase subunit